MYGILIVEDNPTDAKLLSYQIEKLNYTCHIAANAYEALDCLQKFHIDLILLDWMLPQISGMDLLKSIRSNSRSQKTPVMIVSGKNEIKDVEKAIKTGASDYIIKPVDPAILEAKLQRFLNHEIDWKPVQVNDEAESIGLASFAIRVSRVSEVGVEIETALPIQSGALIQLAIPLFQELGISKVLTKVFSSVKENSTYKLKCSIVGLKESDLQKVRLKIRTLQMAQTKVAA